MPKSKCDICGKVDDSGDACGICLQCQEDCRISKAELLLDMYKEGTLPPKIARALMQRKKFADVFIGKK